jgi:glycosyltransferase involved in cell wall biosynthesis
LYSILDKYQKDYDNVIERIPLEKNVGLGAALNIGLNHCRNELVARMDSDDISFPNRMEIQLKHFSDNQDLVILGTQIIEFSDVIGDMNRSRFVPVLNDKIKQFAYSRSPFNHPTVMYKKSYIQKIGGYKEIRRKEDLDLFLRAVLVHSFFVENLDKPLLYYRSNKQNFKRRKTLTNCREYISVVNNFRRMGYIPMSKYLSVFIMQTALFIMPIWLQKLISNKIFRKKNDVEVNK